MKCELIKKTKEVEGKKHTNFYLRFENGKMVAVKCAFDSVTDFVRMCDNATYEGNVKKEDA